MARSSMHTQTQGRQLDQGEPNQWKELVMAPSSMHTLIFAMRREIAYQNKKYGEPDERQLNNEEYWSIAMDELEEAAKDIKEGDMVLARQEALQAMTVIVQWLMFHGVEERDV